MSHHLQPSLKPNFLVDSKTSLTGYIALWSLHPPCPKYEFDIRLITLSHSLLQAPLQATDTTTTEVVPTPNPDVDIAIDGATAEIPFVPASQRQTTSKPEIIDDAIVVVGQRQKKRKRAAKADVDNDKPTAKPKAEVVPFDFASASNVLDDDVVPEQADARDRKRKRQKRGVLGACMVCRAELELELMLVRYSTRGLPGGAERWEGGQRRECVAYFPHVMHKKKTRYCMNRLRILTGNTAGWFIDYQPAECERNAPSKILSA